MDINGARVLAAGATGALGAALTAELMRLGARPAIAGRDRSRLSRITGAHADRAVGAVVTAPATDGERVRTAPDGEPVVERRAR